MLFEHQVQVVCQTYLDAPALCFQHHTHTVSVDEMTGIQASERNEHEGDPRVAWSAGADRIRIHPERDSMLDRGKRRPDRFAGRAALGSRNPPLLSPVATWQLICLPARTNAIKNQIHATQ